MFTDKPQVFAGVFFAQVSLIPVLWQAGLCPLTPDPSFPLGARGGFCVLRCSEKRAWHPSPLESGWAERRMSTDEECFSRHG